MTRFGGDTRKAADALGISRATLYRRLTDLKQG
jgi:transcriptional regulator of acetoin/glycerol metabolism